MYAVEFETDIADGIVRIPSIYPELKEGHAKVVVMVEEKEKTGGPGEIDFSQYPVDCFKELDGLTYQREIRDEW